MSREDVTSDGAAPTPSVGRLRRPTLERTEPRRGWSNLYAPGKADAASGVTPAESADVSASVSAAPSEDAATRAVREGYRIVEENLRRGRQVAAELRGAGREVADFAGRVDPPRVASSLAQMLIDPALTEQLAGVARSFLSVLSAAIPPTSSRMEPPVEPPTPLHPQERSEYSASPARVIKLRSVGPGEWLADLEVEGKVRRVQIRAVDGEL